nr:hypothetical protein [Tanacetum cinerariifolium]
MPPPDPNNTYIKTPSEFHILEFIKTFGYDEDHETKMIVFSKMVATRLHQPWRAILSVRNRYLMGKDSRWDTDNFEWKIVKRSSKASKMSKLLYTRFTKLIIDYIHSHNKSSPRRSDSKLHCLQDDQPITKLLSITNAEYKFGMEVPDAIISDAIKKKLWYTYYMAKKVESKKAKIVDEPEEQHVSLVKSGRRKGFICYGDQVANVSNILKKDVVPRKARSPTIAEETVEGSNETDYADKSDMDLFDDNPNGDDDAARCSSLGCSFKFSYFPLTDFMSHLVYIDAQTTLVVHNPEGNPELACYISGASEVALGTHDENHILGPSTVAKENKFKELIQKNELTIADLEVAELKRIKNIDEGDVSKPISFERYMSKSTKPHLCFYNNDYTYLVDLITKEKYT